MGQPAAGDATAPERLFADLSHWRKIAVSGSGVLAWLGALVTADLSDVAPGRAVQAQLSAAAGNPAIRFTVAAPGGSLLLLQDPDGAAVDTALAPYAARAGILLEDRTADLALFAFPGRSRPPDAAGTAFSIPSCLGTGVDVLAMADDHDRLLSSLQRRFTAVGAEDITPPQTGSASLR
ncbi:MAG: hypothetical protein M3387_04370 [Actinomycetota bacterium]|nr:hypothetical protein [Actinomycetota bacterium]